MTAHRPPPEILRPTTPEERRRAVGKAADMILHGGLVAIPTETVYGLAADATSDRAVARIFGAKRRPSFNPLIVHVSGLAMARAHVEFTPLAEKLASAFWPGPLTLVLQRKSDSAVSLLASAGLGTLAVRAPNSEIARELIRACGVPLAAPSANVSGTVSPTTADHVRESLAGRISLIIDGGPCRVGVESTIVKIEDEKLLLLRPGGVPSEAIVRVAGARPSESAGRLIEAPGMLESHYAPSARLRLNAKFPYADEAFLAFGATEDHPHTLNLSDSGDLVEAAAKLFAHLRTLDRICAERRLAGIAAAAIPGEGIGEAINDRLKRAAAPRN